MSFKFMRTVLNRDPNIGLYGLATDRYCLLGVEPQKKIADKISDTLGIPLYFSHIAESELIGIFATGNSNGIILTKIVEKYEVAKFKKLFDINIGIIKSKETAIGNLVLCNDNGCLISPVLKKFRKSIADCLGAEVATGTIAGLEIVGSAAVASNRGCLCHRAATEAELKVIEELLKVKTDIGTVGFGSPFIKSGLLVNSNGAVIAQTSTGPELGRIADVFGENSE
ncbi:MAG: translation initiation factor IF-6 [Candidatus Aenigmatarchaeota archaeon]